MSLLRTWHSPHWLVVLLHVRFWRWIAHSGYFAKTPHFGHLQSLSWRSTFEPQKKRNLVYINALWRLQNLLLSLKCSPASCLLTLKPEWVHDLEVASGWSSCHIWNFNPNSLHFIDITWFFKRRQLEHQRSICQAHIAERKDATTF